jgi:hypothetical protein
MNRDRRLRRETFVTDHQIITILNGDSKGRWFSALVCACFLSQVCRHRRRGRAQQSVLRLPLRRIVHGDKELHLSAREHRHRYAIVIDESIPGQRRQSNTRCQNPDEIGGSAPESDTH